MPPTNVRACLITNPRGGRGALDLTPVLPVLRAAGWTVDVRQKRHGGEATALARAAAREGYDVVVDCGGDGTLSEIVAGALGTDIAVGVLPGGTVNLWAHELGVDRRARVAAAQLVGAVRRRVDVGRVTINGEREHHFLLVAGLGLDGAVMAQVSKPLKRHLGRLAVGVAALQAVPTFAPTAVRAMLDELPWEGRVAQVIVGDTRRYGGFTAITPEAYVDDGQLDVCLITADGLLAAGRQLGALLLQRHPSVATAETYRVGRATIQAPTPLPLQTDGGVVDLADLEPADDGVTYAFTVQPRSLTVLVPRTYNGTLFQPATSSPGALHLVGSPSATGKRRGKGRKARWLRVVAVGVDAITAAADNDRVVTVVRGRKTVTQDAARTVQPWGAFLNRLVPGDLIRVKGKLHQGPGRITARRVRLWAFSGELS